MNIVLDDAVEVKQITKTNDKETRRNLGMRLPTLLQLSQLTLPRTNPTKGRQRFFDSKSFGVRPFAILAEWVGLHLHPARTVNGYRR